MNLPRPIDRPSLKPSRRSRKAAPDRKPLPAPVPLTADRQQLAEGQLNLAYQLAWWFARNTARDVAADELISEAQYALCYAASRFNEARGVPFGAYANMVIRHRLIQTVIRWRDRRLAPMPEWSETSNDSYEPVDPRPVDLCARAAAMEICKRVRHELPPRWYRALRLYYGKGWTLEEVGKALGVSRQRIGQLIPKGLQHARWLVESASIA